jgi:hypothetical protein
MVFITAFIPAMIVFKFFGFDVGIIFTICLSASLVVTGLTGVENIIIRDRK